MDEQQRRTAREPRIAILDLRVRRPVGWLSTKGLYLWSRFSHREEFRSWGELWEIMGELQHPSPNEESEAAAILRTPRTHKGHLERE